MSHACLTESSAKLELDRIVESLHGMQFDQNYDGRGIVICAGGLKYFPCAWVCINLLRYHRCMLPIELWHLGPKEITDEMRSLLEPFGVTFVDAHEVRKTHPSRILNGFEIKPYAIIHSRFREVLLLDADNAAVVDPTYLFDRAEYEQFGAVFWPDFGRLGRERKIWELAGVPFRNEPEFESGQILVDKAKCWKALLLTMWFNENSDFWYRHIHGDKETFHMAWRKLDHPYAMPTRGIHHLPGTMCQHDFDGQRVFQHRNMKKWTLGKNEHIADFQFEEQCIGYLGVLRPRFRQLVGIRHVESQASRSLSEKVADYHRVGYDRRAIQFSEDGTISIGADRMERHWGVREEGAQATLEIFGDDGLTARVVRDQTNPSLWRGHWLIHEKMPLEITILSEPVDVHGNGEK